MVAKQIAPGCFELALGAVNVFLLKSENGWALIDTGFANSADRILTAFQQLEHQPVDIRHIIITHAHPDHIGSLAALDFDMACFGHGKTIAQGAARQFRTRWL